MSSQAENLIAQIATTRYLIGAQEELGQEARLHLGDNEWFKQLGDASKNKAELEKQEKALRQQLMEAVENLTPEELEALEPACKRITETYIVYTDEAKFKEWVCDNTQDWVELKKNVAEKNLIAMGPDLIRSLGIPGVSVAMRHNIRLASNLDDWR